MTIVDMMANSGRSSAAALIERQHRLGGADLSDTSAPTASRAAAQRNRLEFLENFYRYCRQTAPAFRQSWSAWKKHDARANQFRPQPGVPTQPTPASTPKDPKPFRRR